MHWASSNVSMFQISTSKFKADFYPVIALLNVPIKISYVCAVSGAFVSVSFL